MYCIFACMTLHFHNRHNSDCKYMETNIHRTHDWLGGRSCSADKSLLVTWDSSCKHVSKFTVPLPLIIHIHVLHHNIHVEYCIHYTYMHMYAQAKGNEQCVLDNVWSARQCLISWTCYCSIVKHMTIISLDTIVSVWKTHLENNFPVEMSCGIVYPMFASRCDLSCHSFCPYLLFGHVHSCHMTSCSHQSAKNVAVPSRATPQVHYATVLYGLWEDQPTAVVPTEWGLEV